MELYIMHIICSLRANQPYLILANETACAPLDDNISPSASRDQLHEEYEKQHCYNEDVASSTVENIVDTSTDNTDPSQSFFSKGKQKLQGFLHALTTFSLAYEQLKDESEVEEMKSNAQQKEPEQTQISQFDCENVADLKGIQSFRISGGTRSCKSKCLLPGPASPQTASVGNLEFGQGNSCSHRKNEMNKHCTLNKYRSESVTETPILSCNLHNKQERSSPLQAAWLTSDRPESTTMLSCKESIGIQAKSTLVPPVVQHQSNAGFSYSTDIKFSNNTLEQAGSFSNSQSKEMDDLAVCLDLPISNFGFYGGEIVILF